MMKQSDSLTSLQLFPQEPINEEMYDYLQPYLEKIDFKANDTRATSNKQQFFVHGL
jgi:hypothetical protein